MMRRVLIASIALVALAAAGCTSVNPTTAASSNSRGPSYVYVAIGESGASGLRGDPSDLRAQWTQLFYRSALGTDDVLFDFSSGGQTVADVISSVLPQALAVHPNLATVWLSTADIIAGTAPAVFARELKQLVVALQGAGATVLLANAAPPEVFPALESCGSDGPACDSGGAPTLSSPALASTISAYDNVIASVGHQTGADIVDVHSVLEQAVQGAGAERVLSPRGTALSEGGATIVAHAFADRLPRRFRKQN